MIGSCRPGRVKTGFLYPRPDSRRAVDVRRCRRHLSPQSLALFDALASAEKTLHANPGKHTEVPAFELDSTLRFFTRHLG